MPEVWASNIVFFVYDRHALQEVGCCAKAPPPISLSGLRRSSVDGSWQPTKVTVLAIDCLPRRLSQAHRKWTRRRGREPVTVR